MSNIPMIPMTLVFDDYTLILCNGSRLTITKDGDISVDGSVKDAALGLVKYVVQTEFSEGVQSWELNKAIRIEREDAEFFLECITAKRPAFWNELEKEFHRAVKLRAFW